MRHVRLPGCYSHMTAGQSILCISAWVLLAAAVVVASGPLSRIDTASGTGIRPEDVGQFWGSVWLLVGALAAFCGLDWWLTTTTCPRCGRESSGGLLCSECYWRTTDQDAEIEDRR